MQNFRKMYIVIFLFNYLQIHIFITLKQHYAKISIFWQFPIAIHFFTTVVNMDSTPAFGMITLIIHS